MDKDLEVLTPPWTSRALASDDADKVRREEAKQKNKELKALGAVWNDELKAFAVDRSTVSADNLNKLLEMAGPQHKDEHDRLNQVAGVHAATSKDQGKVQDAAADKVGVPRDPSRSRANDDLLTSGVQIYTTKEENKSVVDMLDKAGVRHRWNSKTVSRFVDAAAPAEVMDKLAPYMTEERAAAHAERSDVKEAQSGMRKRASEKGAVQGAAYELAQSERPSPVTFPVNASQAAQNAAAYAIANLARDNPQGLAIKIASSEAYVAKHGAAEAAFRAAARATGRDQAAFGKNQNQASRAIKVLAETRAGLSVAVDSLAATGFVNPYSKDNQPTEADKRAAFPKYYAALEAQQAKAKEAAAAEPKAQEAAPSGKDKTEQKAKGNATSFKKMRDRSR